ncbi:cytochrome P450 [Amycolatopsis thermophila]|uniref:Cytochrome P450 n=1 Tax=Amycolatopsis thermophila TaxID=206084 RepID=A0ABU0ERE0_9PSEU|nr:cytochrome P450 [Amycolatopsis thermophila]MDQ0377868.1 cytochrome P450 [Amycolatopsis thermophila]
MVPEISLTDPEVLTDPFTAYGRARGESPLARVSAPGFGPVWAVTRHEDARAMLADRRFELSPDSYQRPDVPEHCRPYLRTMSEMEGDEHARLRRLVSPAFSARRALDFRPRIEPLVARLIDELSAEADLLRDFARPLPMDVICELVGIPHPDRPRWREYGAAVASGHGQAFAASIPGIMAGARAAIARRRESPGDDILSDLLAVDGVTEAELVTLVWHLVLAGQTPANLIANAVAALLDHPGQLAALRADPGLMPHAVDELIRWCGPTLLTIPRYAREDVELHGVRIPRGDAIVAAVAAVNRDPRSFPAPDVLDVTKPASGHLGFGHGPHFCLGASLARVQTEVALNALLRRPLAPVTVERAPDPGTWRLSALVVKL